MIFTELGLQDLTGKHCPTTLWKEVARAGCLHYVFLSLQARPDVTGFHMSASMQEQKTI